MKKILLVSSEFKAPGWDVKNLPVIQKKSLVTPLHLATIAALTPEDIEVDLWDEAVHPKDEEVSICRSRRDP